LGGGKKEWRILSRGKKHRISSHLEQGKVFEKKGGEENSCKGTVFPKREKLKKRGTTYRKNRGVPDRGGKRPERN